MNKRITIVKAASRTLIDFCVLPGAAVGAEILWIYSMQWKNRTSLIVLALITFVYSNMNMGIMDQLSAKFKRQENTR